MAQRRPLSVLLLPLRNPELSGPLLLAILYFPEKLAKVLPPRILSFLTSNGVVRALKICVALGLIRVSSNWMSSLVLNNFKGPAKLVKSQELALVTGGSSGIGELMARDFSKKGIKAVILDVQPPAATLPSNVYFYSCDVTSPSQLATVAAEIRKSHGHPTILINNAGVTGTASTIMTANEEAVRKVFEVNAISHFWTVKEFLPEMVRRDHGHVVTVASLSAYVTLAGMVDYACTKNAALAFHEGLRQELNVRYKARNVRTTIVTPSWIRTPLIVGLIKSPKFKEPILEPDFVASVIVNQVLSGKSAHLVLPKEFNRASSIRGWPSWAQELLRNSLGNKFSGNK